MNCLRIIQKSIPGISFIRYYSNVTIPALVDSYPLEATIFEPKSPSSNPICVVISEATGSRRQFYFPFAKYLSEEHNLHVITYDYRGIHDRKPTKWNLVEHWAQRDCAGVLSYGFQNYNQVVHIGHSLGGNMHAILPPTINEKISRILLLSATNSYLMYHKWNLTFIQTCALLLIIREPLCRIYGYYPGRSLLRAGVDMPSNIIRQWGRWVTKRECFVDDKGQPYTEGFRSVKCPILAINFADDQFYTRQAFDEYISKFTQASNTETWHLPKGGHFRFFKHESIELWKEAVRFIKDADTKAPHVINK